MNSMEYDTSQTGYAAVLRSWQIKAMQVLWGSKEGLTSRVVWVKVNDALGGESISRASVINFLEDMKKMGVLRGVEETGKGGHHGVYSPAVDEVGFGRYVVDTMIGSLMGNFPDETRDAVRKIDSF